MEEKESWGLCVVYALTSTVGWLTLAIAMFDPVFEGDEPTVGLAVWGKHAAAEVDPVEAVVQPALQEVHAESPVVSA